MHAAGTHERYVHLEGAGRSAVREERLKAV